MTSLLGPSTPAPAPAADGGTPSVAPGDDRPYTPVAMPDLKTLPMEGRHEFKAAIRDGSREAFEAWAAKWAGPRNTGAPASAPPPADDAKGEVSGPDGDAGAPVPDPATAALASKLEEHGSHLDAITPLAKPLSDLHARLSLMSDEEMADAFVKGEANILRGQYRGSEDAYRAGLREIGEAAQKIGIDPKQLYASGALSDPELHRRIAGIARVINQGKAS